MGFGQITTILLSVATFHCQYFESSLLVAQEQYLAPWLLEIDY